MTLRRLRSSNEGWLTSYADLITNLLIYFVLILSVSDMRTVKMEQIAEALGQKPSSTSLKAAATEVKKALDEQKLTQSVQVQLTTDGLEISFHSGVTFDSGQAAVKGEMEEPLAKVMQSLKPFSDKYRIAIEGHTDESPIKNGVFKSNWELSSARAMAIRERLESAGINPQKLRVEAYADHKPPREWDEKNPPPADRTLQRAAMRRVVIRLF
jgi:chemotaxis protein MotB